MNSRAFIIALLSLGLVIGATDVTFQQSGQHTKKHRSPAKQSSKIRISSTKKSITPEERFKVFKSVLASIPSRKDSLTGHPFALFLYSSITGFDHSMDTLSYLSLCRRVKELKTSVSSALANAPRFIIEEALLLARGLHRIGYEYEALRWLSQIYQLSNDALVQARAWRLIIFHGVLSTDTLLLDKCSDVIQVRRPDARSVSGASKRIQRYCFSRAGAFLQPAGTVC